MRGGEENWWPFSELGQGTYADGEEYLNSPADFILIHCKYNLFII